MLSKRASRDCSDNENVLTRGGGRWALNPYHPQNNPEGIIKLGAAENRLCHDMIKERFTRPDMFRFDEAIQCYHNFRGTQELREAVASFLEDKFHALQSIDPEGVFILNGGDSVMQQFAYAVADEGEALLVPCPYYTATRDNISLQFGVVLVPVDVAVKDEDESIGPSREQLEEAWAQAQQQGVRVKGLLLVNPHNPTGLIMSTSSINDCLQFAAEHSLHVCVDEIYGLSVHQPGATFTSVLALPAPDPDKVHVMYGLSKDFALSAYRVGIFYTRNQRLREAFAVSSLYHNVPAIVQHQVDVMLRDREWVDGYICQHQSSLRESCAVLTSALDDMGLSYVKARAGFFVWVNFSTLLYENTPRAVAQLFCHLLSRGLYLNAGQMFSPGKHTGHMRIVFTTSRKYLQTGILRLKAVVKELERDPQILASVNLEDEKRKPFLKGIY